MCTGRDLLVYRAARRRQKAGQDGGGQGWPRLSAPRTCGRRCRTARDSAPEAPVLSMSAQEITDCALRENAAHAAHVGRGSVRGHASPARTALARPAPHLLPNTRPCGTLPAGFDNPSGCACGAWSRKRARAPLRLRHLCPCPLPWRPPPGANARAGPR